ncbi:hypothetical protein IJZ97_01470 [bacterium]|nr:hypothetical protein [bacterium]
MKKQVIAYLHTHWDREWYREFEVFRLRLLRVFDNVLELLRKGKIPSFYFDGQVAALLDYLELRPEKEKLVRKLIKEKKLFIGPFYCLIDEFLKYKTCFEKNLEIGLKVAKDFGCEEFLGYFADTFGHSKNIPSILKTYGIDKAMVWRGVGDLPAEFLFNGVKTVNLVRGYFIDIFSAAISIEEKAGWLQRDLDMMAEKSSEYILLPIGADHLGVETDIAQQIEKINKILTDYEIVLGSPFDYFEKVKFSTEWNDELRDNSKTFVLSGAYSARTKLKQYNVECSYLLHETDKLQQKYGSRYDSVIEYAYKLLLQNQAHDSICGCSTDLVHKENVCRYEKILQISNSIIEELRLEYNFETPIMKSTKLIPGYKVVKTEQGFDNSLLYNTQKIPVTEDYTTIYTLKRKPQKLTDMKLELKNDRLFIEDVEITFTRRIDEGDTYNFGAVQTDDREFAKIYEINNDTIKTSFFDIKFDRSENLVNFKIEWENNLKNRLWQINFILPKPVNETYSEDLNELIYRKFDPSYDLRKHLPKKKGIEAKTNFAPMQRFVWAQNLGIVTKGLTEYEVFNNALSITLLRSIGIISNPQNPSRSTPAGPPIAVPEAQQLGVNFAEFSVGIFSKENWLQCIEEVYPHF